MGELDINIRKMTYDDVEAVYRLELELFRNPWPKMAFEEEVDTVVTKIIVAEHGDEIIGYAILWLGYGESRLTNIAVAKKYQRKSVAKKLLSFIFRLAQKEGIELIYLEVRPSNKAAVSLYQSFGFEKYAIEVDYYQNPTENSLIMKKDFRQEND